MAPTIRTVLPEEDRQWDEFVLSHPKGTIYHHSTWKQVLHSTYGYGPFYVALESSPGRFTGLYPLMQVNSRFTGNRVVSLPFTSYCSPLLPQAALEEIVEFTRARNPDAESLELKTLECAGMPHFLQEQSEYVTHVLDLEAGEEALFKSFHSTSIRQRINRAGRNKVKLRLADSDRDVETFYRLHTGVRKKHGLPPHPCHFFRNMWKIMAPKNLLTVPLLEYRGEVIAGAFVLKYKEMFHFEYSASDERYLNVSPNQMLIWEIIKMACAEGARYLDFGRSSMLNQTLIEFKERWGAKRITLPYFYYPGEKRIGKESSRARQLLASVNRLLPRSFLQLQGRLIYRHLG